MVVPPHNDIHLEKLLSAEEALAHTKEVKCICETLKYKQQTG